MHFFVLALVCTALSFVATDAAAICNYRCQNNYSPQASCAEMEMGGWLWCSVETDCHDGSFGPCMPHCDGQSCSNTGCCDGANLLPIEEATTKVAKFLDEDAYAEFMETMDAEVAGLDPVARGVKEKEIFQAKAEEISFGEELGRQLALARESAR